MERRHGRPVRALAHLDPEAQEPLVLAYSDKAPAEDIAAVLGCSPCRVTHPLPNARLRLTDILDRLDLL